MTDVEMGAGLALDAAGWRERPLVDRRGRKAEWRRFQIEGALVMGDTLAATVSMTLLLEALRTFDPSQAADGVAPVLGAAVLAVVLSLLVGLYEHIWSSPVERFRMRVQVALVLGGVMVALAAAGLPPALQFAAWCLTVPTLVTLGLAGDRLVRALLARLDVLQTRIVLVGDPVQRRDFELAICNTPEIGLQVVAGLDRDDPRLSQPATITGERVDLAILLSCGDGRQDAPLASRLDFPSVVIAREVGDMQTLWLNTRAVGSALGVEISRSPRLVRSRRLKRFTDIVCSVQMLVVAAPVIVMVALAVLAADRHFPFYAQTRIGLRGRLIRVWKVRSMFVEAEARLSAHLAADPVASAEWARNFKLAHDPRILPGIGHFIRKTSLDELPQLWNVVRGDMSLVGPRPFPAYHLAGFDEAFRTLRASVKPGLTGLWQITARSDGDLSVQERADRFYLRNWSLWFDLYILVHTLPAVLFSKGAR